MSVSQERRDDENRSACATCTTVVRQRGSVGVT